ncbi:hypothetical protein JCM17823_10250 [Halorubrum gandharaense]
MTRKTVPLDEEAYNRLTAHKRAGESFSDVVKRLTDERSWTEVAGVLSQTEADTLEDAVEAGRERSTSVQRDSRSDG